MQTVFFRIPFTYQKSFTFCIWLISCSLFRDLWFVNLDSGDRKKSLIKTEGILCIKHNKYRFFLDCILKQCYYYYTELSQTP